MDIVDLFPTPGSRHRKKRIGRGISAGQGKTCGRGHKGDKARGQAKIGFEGGQTPLHRRIPRKRGFTNIFKRQIAELNVGLLEQFDNGTVITPEFALEKKLVRKMLDGLKVLGEGKLTKSLTVNANAFSAGAVAKIIAAGGKAIIIGQGEVTLEAEAAEVVVEEQVEEKAPKAKKAAKVEEVAEEAPESKDESEGESQE